MSSALQMLEASGEEIGAERFVESLALRDAFPPADRPRVVAAMIGALDGHATVDGRAGGLGNPADRAVLRELRAASDALLVGPGTLSVRACLRRLREEHGAGLVVTEGGPTLLRGMFAEGLVDDLVLTLAPQLVAGTGRSVLHGPAL